jgi:predicted RNase H-like nuclease (RuvC/YqgF family)
MNTPYRRNRILRRIGRQLRRSDPHLAAMLAIFARLTAGEAIDSWEQPAPARARQRAAGTGQAVRCRYRRRAGMAVTAPVTARDPRDPGLSM